MQFDSDKEQVGWGNYMMRGFMVCAVWYRGGTDGMKGNGRGGPCGTERVWRGDRSVWVGLA
jgi:hypothetical protein